MASICECFKKKEIINNKAIPILESKNYDFVKALGSGVFGEVVACKNKDTGNTVAVKIVPSLNVRKLESEIWGRLLHPNILPMMEHMKFQDFEVFIMPLAQETLYDCMNKKSFRKEAYSFELTTKWLRDVLVGIDYLHKIQVCHLDVKVDNIIISDNMNALLADFSCVNTTVEKVAGYGLIPCCRAPETCPFTGQWKVNGAAFDLWSYGMLCLHVFAFKWMENHLEDEDVYWQRNVYPWLFEALQLPSFGKLLNSTFPKVSGMSKDVELALNFVKSILRYQSWDRPKPSVILRHALLSKDEPRIILEPDDIWKVDYNDKDLFTTLDAERPPSIPRIIREIKRRKSLEQAKVAENLQAKSSIIPDENKNTQNVIGVPDSSGEKGDITEKDDKKNAAHSSLNADQCNEDRNTPAGYGGDFASNIKAVDCYLKTDDGEEGLINVMKKRAKTIKSKTEFENLILKHSSASFDCVRVIHEKQNIRPYSSDSDISKASLVKDASFHLKTKESLVHEASSAVKYTRSLDILPSTHDNMFSRPSVSDSIILNKSFIKDYEARQKTSQGFSSISGKKLVDPVIEGTSSDSLIRKFDEKLEKQSRQRLIQNKTESSSCFPEEREKFDIQLSASASATVPESCDDDSRRNTCTFMKDIIAARGLKKSRFRRVREWFSKKVERYFVVGTPQQHAIIN